MPTFVAALDCGTTAIKAAVMDTRGSLRAVVARPFPCSPGRDGAAEFDPAALVASAFAAIRDAVRKSKVRPRDIAGVAVANQRATLIAVDRAGAAVGPALSWQDMRGAAAVVALQRRIDDSAYYAITGLPLHPVFSIGKILWLQSHGAKRAARAARYVLVHDYVLHALGCDDFVCDHSNASLTGLLDVDRLCWSDVILDACGIGVSHMPALVPSGRRAGALSAAAARRTGLAQGTPLVSGGGDQQCAGIGAGAIDPGVVAITLGTAAVTQTSATHPLRDPRRRVTCSAHAVPGRWTVEGLQNAAGASLDWWDSMCGGRVFSPSFMAEVAKQPPGAGGAMFFPYLAGSSAPHWDPLSRGVLIGLQLSHNTAAVARAIVEGVSFETREIMDVFAALELPVREVRLTGGCTSVAAWNRIQADLYGRPVRLLADPEATVRGAAILAACGVGAFQSVPKAAAAMVRTGETYNPTRENVASYDRLYKRFVRVRQGMAASGVFQSLAPAP